MLPRRAPYLYNLKPFIEAGSLRWERGNFALRVQEPIQLSVHWQREVKGVLKMFSQEWRAEPGQILYPTWRYASNWEKSLFESKRDEWNYMAVRERNGRLRICIVELFDDIKSVLRRELRHIPGDLIGRKVKLKGEEFEISGDVTQMGLIIEDLIGLTSKFASQIKVSPRFAKATCEEISSILEMLSRAQSSFKIQARQELAQVNAERAAEIPIKTAQGSVYLLQRRLSDLQMTAAVLKRASRWLILMRITERRFQNGYLRLGRLIQELEPFVLKEEMPEPKLLLKIAREAQGIYRNLSGASAFKPYYSWIHSPKVERLLKAVPHAEAGKPKTVLNDLKQALSRIEKGAIGEKPTREELQRMRKRI